MEGLEAKAKAAYERSLQFLRGCGMELKAQLRRAYDECLVEVRCVVHASYVNIAKDPTAGCRGDRPALRHAGGLNSGRLLDWQVSVSVDYLTTQGG